MRQSSGGVSSWTVSLSMRVEIARSRVALVAKGQTGALFLLNAIFGAALEKGLGSMKRECEKSLLSGSRKQASEAGRERDASYTKVQKCLSSSKPSPWMAPLK